MYEQNFHLLPYVCARAFAMLAILPLPGEVFTTGRKLLLCLLLGIVALPYTDTSVAESWLAVFSEFGIGLVLGLPLALLVGLSGMYAEIFDLQRGQTFASFYDPVHGPGSQSTLLFRSYTICLLLTAGCGEALFLTFLESLKDLPAGEPFILQFTEQTAQTLLHFIHSALEVVLTIYLPVAGMLLLIDLCFCFAAKSLPRLQIYNDAFLAKTFLGYLAILIILQSGYVQEMVLELSRPVYKAVMLP